VRARLRTAGRKRAIPAQAAAALAAAATAATAFAFATMAAATAFAFATMAAATAFAAFAAAFAATAAFATTATATATSTTAATAAARAAAAAAAKSHLDRGDGLLLRLQLRPIRRHDTSGALAHCTVGGLRLVRRSSSSGVQVSGEGKAGRSSDKLK
jgi:hypothetical protein